MTLQDTLSMAFAPRGAFKRIAFDDKTDWRAVIHAIQGALCKTQSQMAIEAGVSQAAVSDLYLRASKTPRFHLGRTLERLYDSIPCDVLRRLPPVPAPAARDELVDDDGMRPALPANRAQQSARQPSPEAASQT